MTYYPTLEDAVAVHRRVIERFGGSHGIRDRGGLESALARPQTGYYDDLIQEAGSDAEGIVVTQVVPPYYLTEYKTVALYRRTLGKYHPSAQPNFVSLEGFVDAMVLVEGLKRAGKELTREGLIHGIESIHDLDIGLGSKLKLDYSAKDHKGFDNVIPTVVRVGRAVPFTDWSTAAPK